MPEIADRPCDSVTSLRLTLVSTFLMPTVAPGITAPVWSFTVTFKVASSWARTLPENNSTTTIPTRQDEVRFICGPLAVETVQPRQTNRSTVEMLNKPAAASPAFASQVACLRLRWHGNDWL